MELKHPGPLDFVYPACHIATPLSPRFYPGHLRLDSVDSVHHAVGLLSELRNIALSI